MIDIKRTEWLEVGDIVTKSLKDDAYKVVKVKPNGVTIESTDMSKEKHAIFISDADPTMWYKITHRLD